MRHLGQGGGGLYDLQQTICNKGSVCQKKKMGVSVLLHCTISPECLQNRVQIHI